MVWKKQALFSLLNAWNAVKNKKHSKSKLYFIIHMFLPNMKLKSLKFYKLEFQKVGNNTSWKG